MVYINNGKLSVKTAEFISDIYYKSFLFSDKFIDLFSQPGPGVDVLIYCDIRNEYNF